MSKGNQREWTDHVDNDLIKQLQTTEEYNIWQETLFAIIGYISKELDEEDLINELIADHLAASFQLQKGLEKARYKSSKNLHEEWLLDNSGE